MDDHVEIDRDVVAVVSDRGYRHHRNEDAGDAIVVGDNYAMVVCDGVSSSANPDKASDAATRAAMEVLARYLNGDVETAGDDARRAIRQAVVAAREAVSTVPQAEPGGYSAAPSTTLAVAMVTPGAVMVAGVGDSRAYWLPDSGPGRRLTVDDSWAEAAIASGVPEDAAYAAPQAHVITNWIGDDAPDDDPAVIRFDLDEQGLVIVCSDGLWNYLPEPRDVSAALGHNSDDDPTRRSSGPLAIARQLVRSALDAGGADNVTVAVAAAGGRRH